MINYIIYTLNLKYDIQIYVFSLTLVSCQQCLHKQFLEYLLIYRLITNEMLKISNNFISQKKLL